MRGAILGLLLVSTVATPAQAERFAIACKGKTLFGIGPEAGPMVGGEKAEKAIFVIDEEAQTAGRYLKKTRTLEDVCVFKLTCDRTFSAARVTIRGEDSKGSGGSVWFDWDRGTGTLDIGYQLRMENGNVMASRAALKCVPAPMPTLAAAK